MRIIQELPRRVRVVEHTLVPVRDGTRLAARLWLPEGCEREPVPAILEYIPYRKRDRTRPRDEPMHRYFAGHGYAAVRVDVRGSGDSEGYLEDEYLPIEQQDGVDVLEWIARQPWCSGEVGMIGKSWGGFAALQIAALRPDPLRAVIAVCATDDRYEDDAHYMGGCLLNENLIWGSNLMALLATPPDPALAGSGWRDTWRKRLERIPLFPALWMRHPFRDDYWQHGSIAVDYAAVQCPVLAVSGQADAYMNAVPRLVERLPGPAYGVIGPWGHQYPHQGVPGPAIGFLQEALRFWDRWLKGLPNGMDQDPRMRVWIQEWVEPAPYHAIRPGRFVAEKSWPSPRVSKAPVRLEDGSLRFSPRGATNAADSEPVPICSPPSTGLAAGAWCGFGFDGDAPTDQRKDDERSSVFDSEPLEAPLEILGRPEIVARVAPDRLPCMLAARICDVAPDGQSLRVTYGLGNLALRPDHTGLARGKPGAAREVRIALNFCGHRFAAGHRIRLALSTAYWPIAWPSAWSATVTLWPGQSTLYLPVRDGRGDDGMPRPFEPPEAAPGPDMNVIRENDERREVTRDPLTGEITVTSWLDIDPSGRPDLIEFSDIDLVIGHGVVERFRILDDDPRSARGEVEHTIVARRPGWFTRVRVLTRMSCSERDFQVQGVLRAYEDETQVMARTYDERIRRRGV